MYGSEIFNPSLWWICPILMIVMCFFMMRRRRGSMMCGFGFRDKSRHHISTSDSATDILDKLYASGEIDKDEYEAKKRTLTKSSELFQ
jgi:uncharacterized membrane protein